MTNISGFDQSVRPDISFDQIDQVFFPGRHILINVCRKYPFRQIVYFLKTPPPAYHDLAFHEKLAESPVYWVCEPGSSTDKSSFSFEIF